MTKDRSEDPPHDPEAEASGMAVYASLTERQPGDVVTCNTGNLWRQVKGQKWYWQT